MGGYTKIYSNHMLNAIANIALSAIDWNRSPLTWNYKEQMGPGTKYFVKFSLIAKQKGLRVNRKWCVFVCQVTREKLLLR